MNEENKDITQNIESKINIRLENFEGPLDILLHLIKESKVEIMDIKISDITEQYLTILHEMELDFSMEKTTDFLAMATVLLEIKSKNLLPQEQYEQDEQEDPEMLLKAQLLEYKLFKETAETLKNHENVNRFYKEESKTLKNPKIIFNDFDYEKLLDAFALIVSRVTENEGQKDQKTIRKDRWTVAEKTAFIRKILKDNKQINFYSLFDENYSKMEIITVFLAILELIKFQEIEVIQHDRYKDILLVSKGENNENK